MWCIMGEISFAVSFSTFAGISSGPEALLGFRAFSCFVTRLVQFQGNELREMAMGLLG